MLHEHLQTNIIRSNSLPLRGSIVTVPASINVSCGRVHLPLQETFLRTALVTINVTWEWEPFRQQFL